MEKKNALLVSVYHSNEEKALCQEHLDELALLCETFNIGVLGKEPCGIKKFDASTYVTKGKLHDLIESALECQADLVVFDDEISPAQQRNLEKAFGIPVIDRTEVILGVFAQRAHTKEANLQVELAQLQYEQPRLKRMWTHLGRQRMTGGYLRGAGEKQIEVDRRLIKKRMGQLQREIAEVKAHRDTQRSLREQAGVPVFAIVGYTNAGKSTLLNALTDAGIFVEDKLFATLDTTTRKFTLQNKQEVLLIDTVGFIRKLPHQLVAAFRSTLEEAVQADFLIHLVDASHPNALEQAEATDRVLKELGAAKKTVITVLNKADLCENGAAMHPIRLKYPGTIAISALQKQGFTELEERMLKELKKCRRQLHLRVPQSDYGVVGQIIRAGNILSQEYEGNDVLLEVDLPAALLGKLQSYVDTQASSD